MKYVFTILFLMSAHSYAGGTGAPGPIPVMAFRADTLTTPGHVTLSWVNLDSKTQYFTVWRTVGSGYVKLNTIQAGMNPYSYTDTDPYVKTKITYRLRQHDTYGSGCCVVNDTTINVQYALFQSGQCASPNVLKAKFGQVELTDSNYFPAHDGDCIRVDGTISQDTLNGLFVRCEDPTGTNPPSEWAGPAVLGTAETIADCTRFLN